MRALFLMLMLTGCCCVIKPQREFCTMPAPKQLEVPEHIWVTGNSNISVGIGPDTHVKIGELQHNQTFKYNGQWRVGRERWGLTVYLYDDGPYGTLKYEIAQPTTIAAD